MLNVFIFPFATGLTRFAATRCKLITMSVINEFSLLVFDFYSRSRNTWISFLSTSYPGATLESGNSLARETNWVRDSLVTRKLLIILLFTNALHLGDCHQYPQFLSFSYFRGVFLLFLSMDDMHYFYFSYLIKCRFFSF